MLRFLSCLLLISAPVTAQLGGAVEHGSVLAIPPGVHELAEPLVIDGPCHIAGAGVEVSTLIPPPGLPAFIISQPGRRGLIASDREWQPSRMGVTLSGFTIGGKRGAGQTGVVFSGPIDNLRATDVRWAWLDEPVRFLPNPSGSGAMRESWFTRCGTLGCGAFVIEQTPEFTRGDGHNNLQFIACHFNQSQPGSTLIVRNRSGHESLRRISFVGCFFHTHQRWRDPAIAISDEWEPLILIDASEGRMGGISFRHCDMIMGAVRNVAGNPRTGVRILGKPTNLTIDTSYTGGSPVVDLGSAEDVWLTLSRVGSPADRLVSWKGTPTHVLMAR